MNYNKDTNRPFTDSLLRNSNPKLFYSENSFCIPKKNKDKNNTTDTQFIVYKVGDDSFQIVLQKKKPWNDVDVNCKETWHIKLVLY